MGKSHKKEIFRELSKTVLASDQWVCICANGNSMDILGHSVSQIMQFEDDEDQVVFLIASSLHMNPELNQKVQIALDIFDQSESKKNK
jgi:hypothetical protein